VSVVGEEDLIGLLDDLECLCGLLAEFVQAEVLGLVLEEPFGDQPAQVAAGLVLVLQVVPVQVAFDVD